MGILPLWAPTEDLEFQRLTVTLQHMQSLLPACFWLFFYSLVDAHNIKTALFRIVGHSSVLDATFQQRLSVARGMPFPLAADASPCQPASYSRSYRLCGHRQHVLMRCLELHFC